MAAGRSSVAHFVLGFIPKQSHRQFFQPFAKRVRRQRRIIPKIQIRVNRGSDTFFRMVDPGFAEFGRNPQCLSGYAANVEVARRIVQDAYYRL